MTKRNFKYVKDITRLREGNDPTKPKYHGKRVSTNRPLLGFQRLKSIDGTIAGLRVFPEKQIPPVGSVCGRCGETKNKDGKCSKRRTYGYMSVREREVFEKKVPRSWKYKTKSGHFCVTGKDEDQKVFV